MGLPPVPVIVTTSQTNIFTFLVAAAMNLGRSGKGDNPTYRSLSIEPLRRVWLGIGSLAFAAGYHGLAAELRHTEAE